MNILKAGLRRFLSIAAVAAMAVPAGAGPHLLFDPATGEVIAADRAGEPWYPASLTKLMTAYLVFGKLRAGEMKLDQAIPVSAAAAKQEPSKLGVPEGKTVTVDTALQALLVYSANDMAVVLAEAAGGTGPEFVRLMNAHAERLGLTGTYFANPNGLFDERQVTTARDMAILATAILTEYPEHNRFFSQPDLPLGKRKLANRNSLLRLMKTADGMKTGFICNSGFNLVASATENGRKLVAVVLGERNAHGRAAEAEKLLRYGFATPSKDTNPALGALKNAGTASIVPADMTAIVCKGKDAIHWGRGAEMSGWGVTFGQYETADFANRALRGRVLGARKLIDGGSTGVIKIPGVEGFGAMVWDLEPQAAQRVCRALKAENAACEVMAPESFARIAALSAEKPPQAPAQGSEGAVKKKRKTWSSKKKR